MQDQATFEDLRARAYEIADRGDCSGWLDIAGQLEAEGHARAQHRLRADPILTHMLDVRCSQAKDRNA